MIALSRIKQYIKQHLESKYNEINTTAPMMQRYLKTHKGIEISGSFSTDDGTVDGRPLYVTVLRQSQKSVVEDGFGFVVMKGDGTTYNVYIVDNNALYGSVVFDETFNVPGINSFLVAAMKEILINTTYQFKFNIHEDWSTELYIWPEGPGTGLTPVVTSGALVDGPLGWGGRQIQSSIDGTWIEMDKGTDIGFGVIHPSGYKWLISDLQVKKFSGGIPLQVYEISNNNTIAGKVQVNYYGSGEVKNSEGTVLVSGADVYIARVEDPNELGFKVFDEWEFLGSVDASIESGDSAKVLRASTTDIAEWYLFEDKFYIAVNKNFNVPTADFNTAKIVTNYIEVTNAQNKPVKDRNLLDVWIDPLKVLEEGSLTITLGMSETNITELLTPLFLIKNIYVTGIPESNELNYLGGAGIRPKLKSTGTEYSTREVLTLLHPTLDGAEVTIEYLHANTRVTEVQNFLDSSDYRSPSIDPLVRILPPIVVSINSLSYKGVLSEAEVQTILKDYINAKGSTGEITKSELLSLLYSNGITYIDVTGFDISVIIFDYKDMWINETTLFTSYELPSTPCRWYTDNDFLRITKL